MKFDLHVHTSLSHDSQMTTDELVAAARAAGLSGIAAADHNVFCRHREREGFYIIPSCEFSTDVGHLAVFFIKEDISASLPRDGTGRFSWRDVCDLAHKQGALVFLAHPFSPSCPRPNELYLHLDGIEVFNSRTVHSRIRGANMRALELCRRLNKPFSAGSDAHCPEEVGASYLEFDLPDSAMNEPDFEEKLKAELLSRRGRVFAGSASPFAVLRCKRRVYKRKKLHGRLLKNTLAYILTALRAPFSGKREGKYIEVYTEEEKL